MHREQTIDWKETQSAFGCNPRWTQRFTFALRMDQLQPSLDRNNNLTAGGSGDGSGDGSGRPPAGRRPSGLSRELENLGYLQDVRLELILMKGNFARKDATIGHVRIGQRCCLAGKQHWLETCVSREDADIVRWHELQSMSGIYQ